MKTKHSHFSQQGFTLVDLAITMIVLGLLLAPALGFYNRWKTEKETVVTNLNIEIANKAISDFFFEYKRYPCPALLTLSPSDAQYGRENCPAGGPAVLNGGVPFTTLKIAPESSLDGWHRKLVYAVTEAQTKNPPINPSGGAVQVRYFKSEAVNNGGEITNECTTDSDSYDTIHYLLVSLGPTGAGGYTSEGVQTRACPAGTPEEENCDNDGVFLENYCATSNTSASFYDDTLTYKSGVPLRIWMYSVFDPNIFSNGRFVGINNRDAQTDLDVVGNIRASETPSFEGNVHAASFCDNADPDPIRNNRCFTGSTIAGADPNRLPSMNCRNHPTNKTMSGIAYAQATCQVTSTPGAGGSCPPNQYATGIQSGGIICAPVP